MFEDHASTRIDLACPHCQQLFKVRLRKLHFGADLVCRLCRYEFSATEVCDRLEVQEALARMHRRVKQRAHDVMPHNPQSLAEDHGHAHMNVSAECEMKKETMRAQLGDKPTITL